VQSLECGIALLSSRRTGSSRRMGRKLDALGGKPSVRIEQPLPQKR
jgi:hypothetical protein